jgi:hypothetical protein
MCDNVKVEEPKELTTTYDLEEVLEDFNTFKKYVTFICRSLAADVKIVACINDEQLRTAHKDWLEGRRDWLESHIVPDGMIELNHFKSFAILLCTMSFYKFVVFRKFTLDDTDQANLDHYKTYHDLDADKLSNLLDGQEAFATWTFCFNCIEAYEKGRADKTTDYVSRLTSNFEHEIVSHLLSGKQSPEALYLTMYGLFTRD